MLLVAERSPNKERGFWSSWPQPAVPAGNPIATLVLLVLQWTLDDESFLGWRWHVGFWLSVVIVAIGYYIRTRVTDAPIYQQVRDEVAQSEVVSYGVLEVLKRYLKGVLTAMGLRFAENILYYLVVTFSIVYLRTYLEYGVSRILGLLAIAHVAHFIFVPIVGRFVDSLGRKPMYLAGTLLAATWGLIAFRMFETGNDIVILLLFHPLMYAGQPAIMAELFPTRMRYSGVSLGYQVTSIVAGSLAPIIATALLSEFGSHIPVAIYLVMACVITLIAVLALRETKSISLHDVDDIDRQRVIAEKGTL